MISIEIQDLLNKQVNAELWSAYYYLSMSADARYKGLCGVANWFYVQAREELDHSRRLQDYISAQDARLELDAIKNVPASWRTARNMFEDALKHERVVTSMINNIANVAQMQKDYATLSMLRWFIDEQVEEEQECNELLQQFAAAAGDASVLYQIDRELRLRRYKCPQHSYGEHWVA